MSSKAKFEAYSFIFDDDAMGTFDLSSLPKISGSRESYGVWSHGGWAWKIFPKTSNYNRMKKDYGKAVAITPAYQFFEGRVIGKDGRTRKDGVALASTHISGGLSFKLKDSTGRFKAHIERINCVATLEKLEWALAKAEEIGLRDPQGFVFPEDQAYPIWFIDIHIGSSPSAALVDMRKFVSNRIKKMRA